MEAQGRDDRGGSSPIPQRTEVSLAMERFLGTHIAYMTLQREPRISRCNIHQTVTDRLYETGLWPYLTQYTGSRFEGLPLEVCSDLDIMFTASSYPDVMLTPLSDGQSHQSGYVVAHGNTSMPAFLQLEVTDPEGVSEAVRAATGEDGLVYSRRFVEGVGYKGKEICGPALTGLVIKSHPQEGSGDEVHCFRCPSWPPCAAEFLTRPRPHGWPSPALIDRVQQAGCHVVPVGHPLSDNRDAEWRWSFSVAERELIHNISSQMYGCMYVMKAIKNKMWKFEETADRKSPLCSYFLKTACLWVDEQTNQGDTTAVGMCRAVIDWLMSCYHDNKMPHYFIPEQNLIGHLTPDLCKEAFDWMVDIRADLWRMVLCSTFQENKKLLDTLSHELGVAPVSADCDYRELMSALGVHERAEEALVRATREIATGSRWYRRRYRYHMGWLSSYDERKLYEELEVRIKELINASVLYTLPETVLLPVVENIHSVVREGYEDMCRQDLYRLMGDLYFSFAGFAQQQNISVKDYDTYTDRAVHYYTLGRKIVHPDGWSDRGLGGDVLMATLYYLRRQWEQLGTVADDLLSSLEMTMESEEDMWGQTAMFVGAKPELCFRPWLSDFEFSQTILDDHTVYRHDLHPVVLGFYILARRALHQGDGGTASRMLHNMERCVGMIWEQKSALTLINIIKSLNAENNDRD